MHLARSMHDVIIRCNDVWCDGEYDRNWTEDIDRATCVKCLEAARRFGIEASARIDKLRRGY